MEQIVTQATASLPGGQTNLKKFDVALRVYVHSVDAANADAASKAVEAWFYKVADCGFGLPGLALPCAWVIAAEEIR